MGPHVEQPPGGTGGGHGVLPGCGGLGDEFVGGAAERLGRVEQRLVGGEQDDPAVAAAGEELPGVVVRAQQRLDPVQRDPQQARHDPVHGGAAVSAGRGRHDREHRLRQFAYRGDAAGVGQRLPRRLGERVEQFPAALVAAPRVVQRAELLRHPAPRDAGDLGDLRLCRERVDARVEAEQHPGQRPPGLGPRAACMRRRAARPP